MKLQNKKWTVDEWLRTRIEVLSQWETGQDVDLEEARLYVQSIPKEKCFSTVLNQAKSRGVTLTQPRAGVGSIKEHIQLLNALE